MLNLKDVTIKDLQVENQRLRNKIYNLEKSNLTGRKQQFVRAIWSKE